MLSSTSLVSYRNQHSNYMFSIACANPPYKIYKRYEIKL
jgi:hypothetical protein